MSFPSSPVNGQVYGNYEWDESLGAWRDTGGVDIPGIFYGISTGDRSLAGGALIPFQNVVKESTYLTYDDINNIIEIGRDGWYYITYHMTTYIPSGTGDNNSYAWLEIDSGAGYDEVVGSRGGMYNEDASTGTNSTSVEIYQYLNEGDKVRLFASQDSGSQAVWLLGGSTALLIRTVEGVKGEKGEVPEHEWNGSELRFRSSDGTWGSYTDLSGPPGTPGPQGPQGQPGLAAAWTTGSYSYGALVSHNDLLYISTEADNTDEPGTTDTWKQWNPALEMDEMPLGTILPWHESFEAMKNPPRSIGFNGEYKENALQDNSADFNTDGVMVGDIVVNKTDQIFAKVVAKVPHMITLDYDAFPSGGEEYEVYPQAILHPAFEKCDGQTLNDSTSPFDGRQLPNTNSAREFLRGGNLSGVKESDAFQGHEHQVSFSQSSNTYDYYRVDNTYFVLSNDTDTVGIKDKSGYGTARYDVETRPVNMSVIYIIKVRNIDSIRFATEYKVDGDNFHSFTPITQLRPDMEFPVYDPISSTYQKIRLDNFVISKPYLRIEDNKPFGEHGGAVPTTDTWFTRTLNTVYNNEINNSDLSGSLITLPPGRYYIRWKVPGRAILRFTSRILDITHNKVLASGSNEYAHTGYSHSLWSTGETQIELKEDTQLAVQMIAGTNSGNDDLGISMNGDGLNEIGHETYTTFEAWQLHSISETYSTETVNNVNTAPMFHLREEFEPGTSRNLSQNTWHTRELNTERINEVSGATSDLENHTITLPAGRYYFEFNCYSYATNANVCRLQDVTHNITLIEGFTGYSSTSTDVYIQGSGVVELLTESTLELQHAWDNDGGNNEFGVNTTNTMGQRQIHAELKGWQHNAYEITTTLEQHQNINTPPLFQIEHRTDDEISPTDTTNDHTWLPRSLNTTVINETDAILGDNGEFTLTPGKWYIDWFEVGYRTYRWASIIWDKTHGKMALVGAQGYNHTSYSVMTHSNGSGYIVVNEDTTFQMMHYSETSGDDNRTWGFSDGEPYTPYKIHAQLKAWQVNTYDITINKTITTEHNINRPPTIHIQERQAPGADAGGFLNGNGLWSPRRINSIVINEVTGASFDSVNYQLTVPVGLYDLDWWANAYDVNGHKTRIFDVTHSITIAEGSNEYADTSYQHITRSRGSFTHQFTEETVIELQHAAESESGDNHDQGFQMASRFNPVEYELYAELKLQQVEAFEITRTFNITTENNINRPPKFHIQERQPNDINSYEPAPSTDNTWITRKINTHVLNEITGASLDDVAHQFTLPPGKYDIDWRCSLYNPDYFNSRLYDVTHMNTAIQGYGSHNNDQHTLSEGRQTIELIEETTFELQFIVSDNAESSWIGGHQSGNSHPSILYELYSDIEIFQIEEHNITIDHTITTEHNSNRPPRVHAQEVLPYGTGDRNQGRAGPFDANDTWTRRRINMLRSNEINGVLFSSDTGKFIFPAGRYDVDWYAISYAAYSHTTQLYDSTHNEVLVQGSMGYNHASYPSNTYSVGRGSFELTEETIIEIRHIADSSSTDSHAMGESYPENVISGLEQQIYADVLFQQTEALEIVQEYNITQQHNINFPPTLFMEERQPLGTDAGDITPTWRPRKLNTIIKNEITGASLDTSINSFTLPPGKYFINSIAPARYVDLHRTRLFNETKFIQELISDSVEGDNDQGGVSFAHLSGYIEISEETTFQIQHKSNYQRNGDGMGQSTGIDSTFYDAGYEKYCTTYIQQIEEYTVNREIDFRTEFSLNSPPLFYAEYRVENGQNSEESIPANTWTTRFINTPVTNEITGAELNNNEITLPSGLYWVEWSALAGDVDSHRSRLYDVTHSKTLLYGNSMFAENSYWVQNTSDGQGRIYLDEETMVRIEHIMTHDGSGSRAGYNTNFISSSHETYNWIKIEATEIHEITREYTQSQDNNINRPPILHVQHRMPAGQHGGALGIHNDTWYTRPLNTIVTNEIEEISGTRAKAIGTEDVSGIIDWTVNNETFDIEVNGGTVFTVTFTTITNSVLEVVTVINDEFNSQGLSDVIQAYDTGSNTIEIRTTAIGSNQTFTLISGTTNDALTILGLTPGTYTGTNVIGGLNPYTNQFTLTAGIYDIDWKLNAYGSNDSNSQLYDVTHGTVLLSGSSEFTSTSYQASVKTFGHGSFELTETTTLELQQIVQSNANTDSVTGNSTSSYPGLIQHEIYGDVLISKINSFNINREFTISQNNNINTPPMVHLEERQPVGTESGDFESGVWRTRKLNTVVTNELPGDSSATPPIPPAQFDVLTHTLILPAGEYYADIWAPVYIVDSHVARLQDVSNNTTLLWGTSEFAQDNYYVSNYSHISGRFILSEETSLQVQHQCQVTRNSNGFGVAAGSSISGLDHETYSTAKFWQVTAQEVVGRELTTIEDHYRPPLFYITDQRNGVNGGQALSGWTQNIRELNVIRTNEISGASLDVATDTITLPAGKYYIEWSCPAYDVGYHVSRLHNLTDAQIYMGEVAHSGGTQTRSEGSTSFEIMHECEFQIEHGVELGGSNTQELGSTAGHGYGDDVYTTIRIWQTYADTVTRTLDYTHNVNMPPLLHMESRINGSATETTPSPNAWNIRELNTIVGANEISGASLDSTTHEFTLPAGMYMFDVIVPAYKTNGWRSRLYNVTADTTALWGTTTYANATGNVENNSFIKGRLDLTEETTLRIEYYINNNDSSAAGNGYNETSAMGASFSTYAVALVYAIEVYNITRDLTIEQNINIPPVFHARETYTGTNDSYDLDNAWVTRHINSVVRNEITDAALNTSDYQITLPAGKYMIEWKTYMLGQGWGKSRIQNIGTSTTIAEGIVESGGSASTMSPSKQIIELTETTTLELQNYVSSSAIDFNSDTPPVPGPYIWAEFYAWQINTLEINTTATYTYEANTAPTLIVEERQPVGTESGDFTSGSRQRRVINSVIINEITGAELEFDQPQITLPAGQYEISFEAQAYKVDRHKAWLHSVTSGLDHIEGSTEYAGSTIDVTTSSKGFNRVILSQNETLELQHECETTKTTNGLGVVSGGVFSTVNHECYSKIIIKRIGD